MTRMAGSIKGLNSFLGSKPDYTAQAGQSIKGSAEEFMKRTEANAMVSNAGLKAAADIASAQHYADAGVAASAAAGQSAIVGSISDGLIGFGKGQIAKGGMFNKASSGLSPAMQQASITGGFNLGSGY